MKKYNLKDDTLTESEIQTVHNYPNILDFRKYIQAENLLILIMVVWVELIGCVSI